MKKFSSILDFTYPFLDPAVWTEDQKLHTYHKDFILRLINTMYKTYGLVKSELWVTDIVIIGSLTTSKWLLTSDLDVHIRINLAAFQASNVTQGTIDDAFTKLDGIRVEFDRAKILAPMTQHPIEFYFEAPDYKPSNTAAVGIYSIPQEVWLKEPIIFAADLDFEESKRSVIDQAEALAQELDSSFGKITRQITRVSELEEVVKAWAKNKQQLFYNKIEQKLQTIETEILKDIQLKQTLVDARHAGQDAMSDTEVKFKYLQRFGFFGILSNLRALLEQTGGQVTMQELPLIKKIINESSLKEAFLKEAFDHKTAALTQKYWIDPSGKEFPVGDQWGHYGWIATNNELLKTQYGLNQDPTDPSPIADNMLTNGWTRVTTETTKDFDLEVADIKHIPNYLDDFVAKYYTGLGFVIDDVLGDHVVISDPFPSLQGAINRALRQPAGHMAKQANYNHAYWIDHKGKVYTVRGATGFEMGTSVTHEDWIRRNIDMLVNEYGFNGRSSYDDLINSGWIRIGAAGSSDWGVNVKSLTAIPSSVDNLLAQFAPDGAEVVVEDQSDAYAKITWPVKSVQQAVNRATAIPVAAPIKTATTKKIKQADYSCIMAMIPHELAQEIVAFGVHEIPDEDLYTDEDGELGRELDAHVTIMYGLLTDDAKSVRQSFNGQKPFKVKLGKVCHFQPPERDFDVVTVEVVSEDLVKANEMIEDKFEFADDLPSSGEYKPHITIAYVKRNSAKKHIGSDEFEGKEVELDTLSFSPSKGNKTYFNISIDKESSFVLEKIVKIADFLPSLALNAPDNDWQFAEGGDNLEIPIDPDAVSDESTWDAPCTEGKPRSKEVWRAFISMFSKAFSKKVQTKFAYDKELEEIEKNTLGEDETLLEYQKGFKDLNRINTNKPKTTWDSLTQDGEPSKPTSVTYSPQISNEDNLDQNSPGGYPRRFMGKPKGEWFSNEGEVNKTLIDMLKNRAFSKTDLMIQAAQVENVNGVRVYKNPSWQQVENLWLATGKQGQRHVRYILTPDTNELFVWDAFGAHHTEIMANLGISNEIIEYETRDGNIVLNAGDITEFEHIDQIFGIQEDKFTNTKEAGSQSASVPDYLINEWKTEQIHDDVDSEPYVNHDQRDYPFGMHDSPENTGSGIGWPKDNTRQVVKLDQLDNPAYRDNPFNMTEYSVVYYTAMPMSDGTEV